MGRRTKTTRKHDVTEDVASPEAIASALARRAPSIPAPDPEAPPALPSEDEWRATEDFTHFALAAYEALFGAEVPRPRPFSDWSPTQQAFLRGLAVVPGHLLINRDDLDLLLRAVGAVATDQDRASSDGDPGRRAHLSRYTGVVPARALERVVDGVPLWLQLRRCVDGQTDDRTLEGLRAIPIAERLEAGIDALDLTYHLNAAWPPPVTWTAAGEREGNLRLLGALRSLVLDAKAADLTARLEQELAGESPLDLGFLWLALELEDRGGAPSDACAAELEPLREVYAELVTGRRKA